MFRAVPFTTKSRRGKLTADKLQPLADLGLGWGPCSRVEGCIRVRAGHPVGTDPYVRCAATWPERATTGNECQAVLLIVRLSMPRCRAEWRGLRLWHIWTVLPLAFVTAIAIAAGLSFAGWGLLGARHARYRAFCNTL
jgi:hypothetical protein